METSSSKNVLPKLQRIAKLAREAPGMVFTTLNPALDLALLKEAYRRTRKDGATGVDGRTAAEYSEHLEENLRSLLDRAKSGLYRAPPVRRVHIPKDKAGETRPLGIPTFEDKVLQRAVAMVLEAVYEVDFRPFSYGFRPGRSAHQLLEDFRQQMQSQWGGWVLEADIRKFFDSVDHQCFREVLARRVRDGVITRLIGKWLKAGVFESGQVSYPERGTPQGGVISPLLANMERLEPSARLRLRPRGGGRVGDTRPRVEPERQGIESVVQQFVVEVLAGLEVLEGGAALGAQEGAELANVGGPVR